MATTTAKTRDDVDSMSKRDRLWDSLNYSYGKKAERSDEQYRQAYSQADRQMLSRGMQRSSYGAQTLANLDQKRVEARSDIDSELIADYENRLQAVEEAEQQQANWQKQFDEGVRQYDTNMAYQRERAAASDNQWNMSFNYQKERDAITDSQWQKSFDQGNMTADRQLAYNYVTAILGQGGDPSDDLLARAGLSRADANALKAQIAEAGGGGYSGGGGGRGGSGSRLSADEKSAVSGTVSAAQSAINGLLGNVTGGSALSTFQDSVSRLGGSNSSENIWSRMGRQITESQRR